MWRLFGVFLIPAYLFAGSDCVTDIRPQADNLRGFPVSAATLRHLIDTKDLPRLRAHAWDVFSQMSRKSRYAPGLPIWRTWYQGTQVYSPDFNASERFLDYSLKSDGVNPGPTFIEILFNPSACGTIRSQGLYMADTLNKLDKSTTIRFPNDSVAVKAEWQFLFPNQCLAIPVWNSLGDPKVIRRDKQFLMAHWPDQVQVCPSPSAVRQTPDPGHPPIPEVSLSRFYSQQLSRADVPSTAVTAGAASEAPVTAILLGIHFTTRELENWFWATLWWHPSPDEWPYGNDRPAGKFRDTRWNNYRMNISVDMDWPLDGSPETFTPHTAYNPYLELDRLSSGTRSNCMTCHARAFWNSGLPGNLKPTQINCTSVLMGKTVQFTEVATEGSANFFACLDARDKQQNPLPNFDMRKELRTSFLWSLSIRPQ